MNSNNKNRQFSVFMLNLILGQRFFGRSRNHVALIIKS